MDQTESLPMSCASPQPKKPLSHIMFTAKFILPPDGLGPSSIADIASNTCGVANVKIDVRELPGPWMVQKTVTVTANALQFVMAVIEVLRSRSFTDVGYQRHVFRFLIPSSDHTLLTSNGSTELQDMQRAAGLLVCKITELYALTGETAIFAIGHWSSVVQFVCLVNESLYHKAASTTAPLSFRPIIPRDPLQLIILVQRLIRELREELRNQHNQ